MNASSTNSRENAVKGRGNGVAGVPLWLIGGAIGAVALAAYAAAAPGAAGAVVAAVVAGAGLAAFAGVRVLRARRGLGRGHGGRLGEGLLAQAMEASPEGCVVTSAEGEVAYSNGAYRALVGHRGAGQPPSLAKLVAGDEDSEEIVRRLHSKTLGGAPGQGEVRVSVATEERRWLSLWTQALGEPPRHVVWHVSDSTPQHEARQAIRQEQEKLADFFDSAPIGFFSLDTEGRFVFVNGTLARWLGYTSDEMTGAGMRLDDFLVQNEVGALRTTGEEGAAKIRHGEVRLKSRDGHVVPVYISQSFAPGPGGEGQTRSVVLNLTREQEWAAALRQAEERFRRFFDYAPIGIVTVDDRGRLIEANTAFDAMVDAAAGAEAGTPLVSFVGDDDRDEVWAHMLATLRGEPANKPIEVRLKGSTERVAQLFTSRLEDAAGDVSGLVLHLIDATEQKKLELQFAQSQKMQAVGQLAGGIAHDFNNLLTAMIGFCDLLLLRHQAGDQSFADIMQIKQNANRAANLVRQLLAFSRQLTLQPKVLAISDVLAELSNLLRRLIGEDIELKMVHGRDVGLIKVDQGQFEQVIINLAVNARDAMPHGGELTIRTSNVSISDSARSDHALMPVGEYVLIGMNDTGCGIKEEDLDKIFEPFFTTKEIGAGTGLGLATVYGIVKQTGGFIFAESKLATGASFKIYLPRHRESEATKGVAEDADEWRPKDLTGRGTILLVEDEDAVRTFAARALRNKGYTVLEADSGDSALELVASYEDRLDLLISDVVMSRMDGPTLVRRVRQSWPKIKVILISGYAEDAYRESLDEAAEFNFLPKPFSLKQLAGTVKEVMSAAPS